MESITKPAQVVQPPENSILHPVEAYLDRRGAQEPVHLVQYDTGIPVLTVALFQKDKPYAVPAGAAVNLRLSKPDGTCVYDPVLGLTQDRRTVYVQASRQMTAAAGLANAILEIILNGGVVGTASFLLFLEANPVTDEAILSSGEFKSLDDYVSQAEASAEAAAQSREASANSASAAKASEERTAKSAAAAKASADAAENSAGRAAGCAERAGFSADEAAAKAREAEESAQSALDMARTAQSYAVGGTDTRENEDVDNARYYYDQAKRISQGLNGALLPMGTVRFEELSLQTKQAGYMYNISDAFTTDGTFKEGPGHAYPAGTNVYCTADGFWDCLAGAQVVSVNGRTGAVTITKSDVGLGNVDNTHDKDKRVATAGTADKVAHTLKFTGGSTAAFDGSADQTVAIPTELPAKGGTAANVSGVVAIKNGGTGATDAAKARANLGITAANIGGSSILTEIKKVDGESSGLDADLLDGMHANSFARMRTASDTVSFSNAAKSLEIGSWVPEALDYFAKNNIPSITRNTGGFMPVLSGNDNGSITGFFYYKLRDDYYCGIAIAYDPNMTTVRFTYAKGTYSVRLI